MQTTGKSKGTGLKSMSSNIAEIVKKVEDIEQGYDAKMKELQEKLNELDELIKTHNEQLDTIQNS